MTLVLQYNNDNHHHISKLSTYSQLAALSSTAKKLADKAKIAKSDYVDVTLDDNQSDELSSMMEKIEEQCHNELDKLMQNQSL